MKSTELNLKAEELLNTFETIPNPSLSADWTNSLMQKIANTKQHKNTGLTASKVSLVAALFILLNIGFFVSTLNSNSTSDTTRSNEFQTISNELLIPSTTATN